MNWITVHSILPLQPHRKPHPPPSGRASRGAARLRHLPASTSYSLSPGTTLNRNLCLPPVGHSVGTVGHHHPSLALSHSVLKERIERLEREEEKGKAAATFEPSLQTVGGTSVDKLTSDSGDDSDGPGLEELSNAASLERLSKVLSRVIDSDNNKQTDTKEATSLSEKPSDIKESGDIASSKTATATANASENASKETKSPDEKSFIDPAATNCDSGSLSVTPANVKRDLLRLTNQAEEGATGTSRPVTSNKVKDVTLDNLRESLRPPNSSKGKSKMKTDYTLFDSLRDTLGASSSMSRHSSLEKRKEFTLESLSTSEARAMSGLLRQASLEKVGSSRIGNVTVTSASRNRVTGNYMLGNSTFPDGRITTPEGRLVVRTVFIISLLAPFKDIAGVCNSDCLTLALFMFNPFK